MINGKSYFVWGMVGLLTLATGYYVYDMNKTVTDPLSVNNEKVVVSLGGKDKVYITEKEYEEELEKESMPTKYAVWRNYIIDESIKESELTEKEKQDIKDYIKNIRTNTKSQYGDDYDWKVKKELSSSGFTSYRDYARVVVKSGRMKKDYVSSHLDEYKEAIEQLQCRKINVVSATSEDTQKNYEGKDISKETGIYKGYVDNTTSVLPANLVNAVVTMKEGETTEWILDSNTSTYYKAYIYDVGYEKNKDETALYESVVNSMGTEDKIVHEYAKKLKIDYKDKDFQKAMEERGADDENKE